MRLYTYRCAKCDKTFDARRKSEERSTATCPDCNTESSVRVIMPVARKWNCDKGGQP